MAGAFGMMETKRDLSLQVARSMLEKIRAEGENVIVIASGNELPASDFGIVGNTTCPYGGIPGRVARSTPSVILSASERIADSLITTSCDPIALLLLAWS